MSTSNRTLIIEAAAVSAFAVIVTWLVSPTNLGVPSLAIHPAWLPVTLFAARYGVRGLFMCLVATAVPLLVIALLGDSPAGLLARAHNPSDVFALTIAVSAAWIGMAHENRVRRVTRQLTHATGDLQRADTTALAMSTSLQVLRSRCDRMDASLTVWRSLANRLERGTPEEASYAALELAVLRCAATAGVVQIYPDDGPPAVVAHLGTWKVGAPRPKNLEGDLTVAHAAHALAPMRADQVDGASPADSDIAVPILDERDGSLLGVLALRGVDPANLCAAELRDLRVIADWLSAPVQRFSLTKPRLRAVQEEMSR
jgi:hypothetical protein